MKRGFIFNFLAVLAFIIFAGTIFLLNKNSGTENLSIMSSANLIAKQIFLDPNSDISPQKPLPDPPKIIKGVYATSWSAGSDKKIPYLIDLIKKTELNSIVIDIKDYTGTISYISGNELFKKYAAEEKRIPKINALIKRLHDSGIYVIGRIAVFEDQKLSLARPELSLHSKKTGNLWKTWKGLYWMDTASKDVWDYNITVAKDALDRGFDEINFDYIRFASDGELADIQYPAWDGKTPKKKIIQNFFEYIRKSLGDAKLSVDLFGMVTTNKDDLGIGQYLEDAFPYFDAISPMVYPSHYISGFLGFKNPALAPYEVVRYSMDEALKRIASYENNRATIIATQAAVAAQFQNGPQNNTAQAPLPRSIPLPIRATLRPWLQDFNLGANYDIHKVQAQIRAVDDSAKKCAVIKSEKEQIDNACDNTIHDEALGDNVRGWMLWNSSNVYTRDALKSD